MDHLLKLERFSLVFTTQSYCKVPKDIRINSTHCFMMNCNKLQRIAINRLPEIDFKDFMKIYKKCTTGTYFFYLMRQF